MEGSNLYAGVYPGLRKEGRRFPRALANRNISPGSTHHYGSQALIEGVPSKTVVLAVAVSAHHQTQNAQTPATLFDANARSFKRLYGRPPVNLKQ